MRALPHITHMKKLSIVRYSKPQNEAEKALRFVLLDEPPAITPESPAYEGRVHIRAIVNAFIQPVECLHISEIEPCAEAEAIVEQLNPAQIAYAASHDRGEFRGFAALHDLMDANMLLPGAEDGSLMDRADWTDYANGIMNDVSLILLAHPLANLPK